MSGCLRKCLVASGNVRLPQEMSGCVRKCLVASGNVWLRQEMSDCVRKCHSVGNPAGMVTASAAELLIVILLMDWMKSAHSPKSYVVWSHCGAVWCFAVSFSVCGLVFCGVV